MDTTRRHLLRWALAGLTPASAAGPETHQATGVKAGEVTPSSARIWTRRTRASVRRPDGLAARRVQPVTLPLPVDTSSLEGSCPGEAGAMRVLLRPAGGGAARATDWAEVDPAADFSHQFPVEGLRPATPYSYTVETRAAGSRKTDGVLTGAFQTAPAETDPAVVDLAMLSCQKYSERDDERGFHLYDAISRLRPHFYFSVGDNVYYDSDDPLVNHTSVARHHWNRMFSLPRIVDCLRALAGYWLKDDHDCYSDDCWPDMVAEKLKPFRWEEGLKIFPGQVPIGPKPYRSFRWGRGLEVWLLEGRDFRAPNPLPDGPSKSIWGETQKSWLKQSLAASTADWRLIVSPTPMVGPDRPTKHDNHSNDNFQAEGEEFRRWLAQHAGDNTFVLCGDRHWQYHSIDPSTGVREFGCGAASDSHAGGTPGENPRYHRFHRVKGGFLSIRARPESRASRLTIEHRDVHGNIVYAQSFARKV